MLPIACFSAAAVLGLEQLLEIVASRALELVGEDLVRKARAVLTRRLESLRWCLVPTIYAATFPAASTSTFARRATEWRTLIVKLACAAEHALRSGEGHTLLVAP